MRINLALLATISLLSITISAQTYDIDPGHSSVQIQVERFGVVDVVGRFKDLSGEITYDTKDISKTTAKAIIKVESYDANNIGGEKAVKSKAFLDAESFPEISFDGNKTYVKGGTNFLKGSLTVHGVTKEIELPYTIKGPLLDLPTKKQSIALRASTMVNRQDYGIAFDKTLPNGIKIVGNEVKITIIVLALEK